MFLLSVLVNTTLVSGTRRNGMCYNNHKTGIVAVTRRSVFSMKNEILIMGLCDIRVCILQPPALSQSVGLPQNPKAWACRRLLFAERNSDDFSWCEETFLANSFLEYPSAMSSSLRWRVKVVG